MKQYAIKDVSKITGCTVSVLRIWESRYGWPRSQRLDNGYRTYSELDVDEIKKVCRVMKATGKKVGELIVDGYVEYNENIAIVEPYPKVDFTNHVGPSDKTAAELYKDLIIALTGNNMSKVHLILQMVKSIRPSERKVAVVDPIMTWVSVAKNTKKYALEANSLEETINSLKL